MKPPQLPALTGLRFVAAFSVMYAHSISYFLYDQKSLLASSWIIAHAGMSLFFVLSGFVIHYNYGRAAVDGNWGPFIAARIARLYPLYFLFLILDFAARPTAATAEFWQLLPQYITLTQQWFPLAGRNVYLEASWSISADLCLYLLYIPVSYLIGPLGSGRAAFAAFLVWFMATLLLFGYLWSHKIFGQNMVGYFINPHLDASSSSCWARWLLNLRWSEGHCETRWPYF